MKLRLNQDPRRGDVPPDRPQYPWTVPFGVPSDQPAAPNMAPWLEERLFDQRIVMLNGPLTGPSATRTAAALLTLDALGSEVVRLHMSTPDGDLTAAFAVVDAIDAMRAPVHAVVTAQVGGAALAVLAAAERRLAYRHASIRICEPTAGPVVGTADEVAAAAGQYLRELEELAERIATVTGQPRSRVEDDLSAVRILTSADAREYGLIDEIIGGGG